MRQPMRAAMPRRELLTTAAGAVLLAPLLRARKLYAQAAVPKRLVLFFTPNSHPVQFFPTGEGSSFVLQDAMKAFRGLEQHLLFTQQIHHTASAGNHHESGPANAFTGADYRNFNGGNWPAGPSIDHIVAPKIYGGVPKKNYLIKVRGDRPRTDSRAFISYSGPGQPVAGISDPVQVAKDIFSGTSGSAPPEQPSTDTGHLNARIAARSEILKINAEQIRDMQKYLGAEEKAKLDLHITSIGELERQIKGGGGSGLAPAAGGECVTPALNGKGGPAMSSTEDMQASMTSYFDTLAAAFQCDQLRVAAVQMGASGDDYAGLLGHSGSWHDTVAHEAKNGGKANELFQKHLDFFAQRLAAFAHKLDSIKEGNGTILDHTIILWGVESGAPHTHNPKNIPYLLVGGRGLGVRTGQLLKFGSSQPCTKLLTGVCNALGVPMEGIGNDPKSGVLPGMLG